MSVQTTPNQNHNQTNQAHRPHNVHYHYYNQPASYTAAASRYMTNMSPVYKGPISSSDRLIALILSAGWFFGFCGLHRFYVGKIWTGLLWFFTGGLLGIGQFIDIVLITTGEFKDGHGRKIKAWTPEEASRVQTTYRNVTTPHCHAAHSMSESSKSHMTPASSVAPVIARKKREWKQPMLGFSGVVLLFTAMISGALATLDLTGLYESGVFNGGFNEQMTAMFGVEWPVITTGLLSVTALGTLMISTASLSLARARKGALHISRVLGGVTLLGLSALFLNRAVDAINMTTVGVRLDSERYASALEAIFNQTEPAGMLFAMIFTIGGVTMLLWPERRNVMKKNIAVRKENAVNESGNKQNKIKLEAVSVVA